MTRERFGEVKMHLPSMTIEELYNAATYAIKEIEDGHRKYDAMMGELVLRGYEYPTYGEEL
jgi:hypothetical protein